MSFVDFFALALAADALIVIWFHYDSPVASLREKLAASPTWWVAKLATCRFCLMHWAPILVFLFLYTPSLFVTGTDAVLFKLPLYSLATTNFTRILYICNPRLLATCLSKN